MALLARDHSREEFLDRVPVADEVDVEDLLEVLVGDIEDAERPANAGVVDENGRVAELGLDLVGDLGDAGGLCNVALVEVDVGDCEVSQERVVSLSTCRTWLEHAYGT